jgi:predicted O-methyltransferase YrrM
MTKKGVLPVHMAAEEFSQLLAVVHTLAPQRCLEWGSGGSTRALLEQCPFVERYVSIEHDRTWYDKVRSVVTDSRLDLHYVAPNVAVPPRSLFRRHPLAWYARAEVDRTMFADYIDLPATLDIVFDFVLVDGRARRFCMSAGWMLLRPGGLLVLHDAQRPEYHDVLCSLGQPVFLQPWRRGQIGLLRRPAKPGWDSVS